MNSRRLKILWMPLTIVTAAATIAACSSSSGSSSSGGNDNATFTTIGYTTTITPGAPMNPFAPVNNIFPTYDSMQLAWLANNQANPNQEVPGLASSWTVSPSGTSVTVHLQPGAKWSNGQPVTATDVKESAAIWIATGDVTDLGSVTIDNPTTVTLNEAPGPSANTFVQVIGNSSASLTQQDVVPSSEYGKLLPANIWSTIAASEGPAGAAKTAAASALASLAKTIEAYSPKTDISAGPFYIKRLNTSQALLVKNPDFYAASKVHIGEVIMEHQNGASQITDLLQSNTLDYSPFTGLAKDEENKVEAAGNKAVTGDGLVAAALVFDENDPPYNNVKVRQALAYVLNRPAIQKIGEPVVGTASSTISGAISSTLPSWLSSQQRSSLNAYAPDSATATSLLKSAGLTQKGGHWYLANGKQWTMNIPVPQGFSDWLSASSAIKSELDSFGIPTTFSVTDQWPQYQSNELFKGSYPVGWWLMALGTDPYTLFSRIYGPYDGYNSAGAARLATGAAGSDNFVNAPATVSVPGAGTVNPGQLTGELNTLNLNTAAGLAQQKQIGAQLIQTINYEVPVIQLWDYQSLVFLDSKRFTDWPTDPNILGQQPGVWMADGYVEAK
jgi:peptide/nickel transport system substrate-binding protein